MPDLDEQLARAVEAIPGIAAMAVFGSRASGSARPDSDLDVAILPSREEVSRRSLLVSVAIALAELAPEGRVDVVLLDEAPELRRHQVLSTGHLVLCRDAQAWRDLRVETMREHGDREWARDLLRRAQRRHLEGGESGSRPGHVFLSLRALETYLAELRTFLAESRDEFVREPSLHHLAERYLHLACESVLDISHHVIADQGYRQPGSYKDAIDVLLQEGLLDADLAGRLKRWMGLRNLLVHLYLEIDHGRIYDAIAEDLVDLQAFASLMARMLEAR